MDFKLVIVVRTDLGISKGKMAAQVAHAAVNCSLKSKKSDSSNFKAFAPCVIIELFGFEKVKDCEELVFVKSEYPVFLFCIL